ncbi:hypothetical protein JI721_08795 [Alicyclobacillus cycloheptanicus]|uniref:Uncharacterized protein n=1 Tax=Alicyclobacillus cycloheptanicus TaxID=1457 RepID=A0ABT9XKB5_9BACL|nr:hypothetical protein [Alicyclobacillus cycloheptanicus]MDQ0190725.1 hypothetical protein [Alicyclobacillus cycloheptanicus]WDL99880.1 hypothetical protein JI721_08795 [Alicyclobacillus cycloheptanicus]
MASQVAKLPPHKVEEGAEPMTETTEILWFGNTKVTVYSPLGVFAMTSEERQAWFARELEANNPIAVRIAEAAVAISERLDGEGP